MIKYPLTADIHNGLQISTGVVHDDDNQYVLGYNGDKHEMIKELVKRANAYETLIQFVKMAATSKNVQSLAQTVLAIHEESERVQTKTS